MRLDIEIVALFLSLVRGGSESGGEGAPNRGRGKESTRAHVLSLLLRTTHPHIFDRIFSSQLSPKGLAKIDALIMPLAEELARTYPARQSYVHAMHNWAETLGAKHDSGWLGW